MNKEALGIRHWALVPNAQCLVPLQSSAAALGQHRLPIHTISLFDSLACAIAQRARCSMIVSGGSHLPRCPPT